MLQVETKFGVEVEGSDVQVFLQNGNALVRGILFDAPRG
jgi:hypothetical protein